MKTICLYFEIHQNIHLKRYRFFEIGKDHYYFDDYENERGITETAERSYLPALRTFLEMAQTYGKAFKVAFSISGCALELLEQYAPEVIELLQELNETGCVEFLAEPYSHGLSSLANEDVFRDEVGRQAKKMKELFGHKATYIVTVNERTVAQNGGLLAEELLHLLGLTADFIAEDVLVGQ